jgi:Uma2 family endonuclease
MAEEWGGRMPMKTEENFRIDETRQANFLSFKKQDDELLYPTSDGKPMAETEKHVIQLAQLLGCLRTYFASEPEVYVSGNNMMYYEEGNPRKKVSPDIYVTLGIPKHERRSYRLWVEGKAPDFILELLSGETRRRDFGFKKKLYQNVFQTKEYFLYDPDTEELYGYQLIGNRYSLVKPDANSRFFSSVLELLFGVDTQGWLRVYTKDGTLLKTQEELAEEVMELSARNTFLEEQLARIQSELARLREER